MTSSASNSVRFSAASGRALATTRRSAVVVVAVVAVVAVAVAVAVAELLVVVVAVAERGGDVAALLTTRCRIFRPGCPSAMNDWFAALPFFFFID